MGASVRIASSPGPNFSRKISGVTPQDCYGYGMQIGRRVLYSHPLQPTINAQYDRKMLATNCSIQITYSSLTCMGTCSCGILVSVFLWYMCSITIVYNVVCNNVLEVIWNVKSPH